MSAVLAFPTLESAEHLLTKAQVARRLDVTERTLERMVAAGDFPRGLKRSRRWVRWHPDTVTQYLTEIVRKSAS